MTGTGTITDLAAARDAADPLARMRDAFEPPDGIYLDGNSLGPPPRAIRERLVAAVDRWARSGVEAWPEWLGAVRATADRMAATVLDVPPADVALSDSTSVNLYKLVEAVVAAAGPQRRVIVVDPNEFPTNRYIVDGVAARHGMSVRPLPAHIDEGIDESRLEATLTEEVAAVVVSRVNYRSGAILAPEPLRAAARRAGATVVWDLSHSAGVLTHRLDGDLAVGATYKHLGGGPGSPALLVVPGALQERLQQPIWGWFAHRDQFGMHDRFEADASVARFLVGTPPVLSAAPLDAMLDLLDDVGVPAVRERSLALVGTARAAAHELLVPLGFRLASPADPERTGAHLTLEHPAAWPVCQAARERGVVVDHREPGRIRLGPSPLYTRHEEIVEACLRIADVVGSGEYHRHPAERHGVT